MFVRLEEILQSEMNGMESDLRTQLCLCIAFLHHLYIKHNFDIYITKHKTISHIQNKQIELHTTDADSIKKQDPSYKQSMLASLLCLFCKGYSEQGILGIIQVHEIFQVSQI